jgi:hypothetical protein
MSVPNDRIINNVPASEVDATVAIWQANDPKPTGITKTDNGDGTFTITVTWTVKTGNSGPQAASGSS